METSSLPIDSSRPLFKQIEIFSGILTAHFKCQYLPLNTCQRALGRTGWYLSLLREGGRCSRPPESRVMPLASISIPLATQPGLR